MEIGVLFVALNIILLTIYAVMAYQTKTAIAANGDAALPPFRGIPEHFYQSIRDAKKNYDWRIVNRRLRGFRKTRHEIVDDEPYDEYGYCPIAAICDDPAGNYKPYVYGGVLGLTVDQTRHVIRAADGDGSEILDNEIRYGMEKAAGLHDTGERA